MKITVVLGIVLIILGVAALAYKGVTYTTHEQVLNIGPIKATAERDKTVPIPAAVGVAVLVGGIVLVVAGSKK